MTSETQQRHCARSSVTNVLSLEENSPQSTSLSNLLEMPEINFEENWRNRTLSKLETLFHVTNVTTVLNASVVSDRVSRYPTIRILYVRASKDFEYRLYHYRFVHSICEIIYCTYLHGCLYSKIPMNLRDPTLPWRTRDLLDAVSHIAPWSCQRPLQVCACLSMW